MTGSSSSGRLDRNAIELQAKKILQEHDLFAVPVNPVEVAAKLGIRVNNAVFADEQLAGMISKRGASVTLLVKQADHPYRKRFTIAHELGHDILHLREGDGDRVDTAVDLFRSERGKPEEVEANQFAAALLMPEELVRREVEANPGITLEELAVRFRVSESAMGIRLGTLELELSSLDDVRASAVTS